MITRVESNTQGWLTCADYTLGVRDVCVPMSADKKETGFFRTRASKREGMIPGKGVRWQESGTCWQYSGGGGGGREYGYWECVRVRMCH